jgi:hypothetical protein
VSELSQALGLACGGGVVVGGGGAGKKVGDRERSSDFMR